MEDNKDDTNTELFEMPDLSDIPEPPPPPVNIQAAIDRWKVDHSDLQKPQVVKLEKREDFDSIKHYNSIIEFPPGGKVGDEMWTLQHNHNLNVILSYYMKKKKLDENLHYAPETYLMFDKDELPKIKYIEFYVNNLLLDRYSAEQMYVLQEVYDLTPFTYNKTAFMFERDNMYFLKMYDDQVTNNHIDVKIKRMIVYRDGTNKEITDDMIHTLKY